MSDRKRELLGPGGIRLVLDRDQVFPSDPGQGTPAMVYLDAKASDGRKDEFWGTYNRVDNEGTVSGSRSYEEKEITDAQLNWLREQDEAMNEFLFPE